MVPKIFNLHWCYICARCFRRDFESYFIHFDLAMKFLISLITLISLNLFWFHKPTPHIG